MMDSSIYWWKEGDVIMVLHYVRLACTLIILVLHPFTMVCVHCVSTPETATNTSLSKHSTEHTLTGNDTYN